MDKSDASHDETLPAITPGGTDRARDDLITGGVVGEFAITDKLGEGGFGTVYRAVHQVIGRVAAVKILHARLDADPEMLSRFVAEARAINRVRHRNVIDVFAFGQLPDGRPYYVMEYLEGEPLDAHLARRGRMAPADALFVLDALARALDSAHSAGIVHRDIKPDNVFLAIDAEGMCVPKLLDFGIAKQDPRDASTPSHRTKTGVPIGTPAYMAPEQCRGLAVDARSDVYALGVVAFELFTGRLPFLTEGVLEAMNAHVNAPPPSPSSVSDACPSVFDGPVLQMLAKEPELRPASAGKAVEPLIAAARAIGIKLSESGIAPAFVQASVPPSPSVAGIARTTAGPLRGRRTPLWIAVPAVASALVVFAVVMSRGGREGASSASAPLASASPQVAAPPPFVTVSGEPAPETSPVQPSATDASARRDGGTSPAALPRDRRPRPPRTVHGALEDPF